MAEGGGLADEREEDEALEEEEEDIFILSTDHGSKHRTEEEEGEEGLENIEEKGPILSGEGNRERWKMGRGVLARVEAEDDDEEVVEKEEKRELLTPTNWEWEDEGERDWESEELSSPSGMPGTTPPAGSRYMKHARKGHKYKGAKKMSLGHIPKRRYRDTLQRRPQSMLTLQTPKREGEEGKGRGRRNTAPTINTGKMRRQSRQGAGGGGRRKRSGASGEGTSPHHMVAGDDRSLQRRKKRNHQQRIAHDRDKKATQNPSSPLTLQPTPQPPSPNPPRRRPPLIPVQSVDIPDYTPSLHLLRDSPTDPLTSSLNFLPPLRSSSAGLNGIAEDTSDQFRLAPPLGRVYRSYSDAHVTVPTGFSRNLRQQEAREGAVCPLDRKQFFKRFQKALKYAAGISRPQPQPAETPFHPHMSRYHSENLGLENPRGM